MSLANVLDSHILFAGEPMDFIGEHAGRFAQRLESLAQIARQQRMRFISCLTTDDPLTVLRESLCHRHPLR